MITVEGLFKGFGSLHVLENVNAHIERGECVALIGPSGTGKSVFLRSLAMLETPDSGRIYINGTDITQKGINLNHVREKMGMVYQGFHLFEHLNILDNITLAPRWVRKQSRKEAERRAQDLLSMVGLTDKARSYPRELSGGQQQRIAIARCMAMEPEIMLFDEPTSALDPIMTREVLTIIRKLSKMELTMLIVTHEMSFAQDVAHRVFYMDEGGIYEEGTPSDIFENPQREKTRAFITRLKTFNYEIHSIDFDMVSMNAQIEVFCYKHGMTWAQISRIQLLIEELIMEIFRVCYQDIRPDMAFTIAFAEETEEISISLTYRADFFNPLEFEGTEGDPDHLGIVIVNNLARQREHMFADGRNTINLKL